MSGFREMGTRTGLGEGGEGEDVERSRSLSEPVAENARWAGQLGVRSLSWPPWACGAWGKGGHLSHELGGRGGGQYARGNRPAPGRRPEAVSPPPAGGWMKERGPGLSLGALRLQGSGGGRASEGDCKGQPALVGMAGAPGRARVLEALGCSVASAEMEGSCGSSLLCVAESCSATRLVAGTGRLQASRGACAGLAEAGRQVVRV